MTTEFGVPLVNVAAPLAAFIYLCVGEAWVQHRIVNGKEAIGPVRHAALVTGWFGVMYWRCLRWYYGLGKRLRARLRG